MTVRLLATCTSLVLLLAACTSADNDGRPAPGSVVAASTGTDTGGSRKGDFGPPQGEPMQAARARCEGAST